MRKFLNNPWIVGALAIAAVAFVAHSLMPAGEGERATAMEDPVVSETPVESPASHDAVDADSIRAAIKELPAGWAARDPFAARKKIVPVPTSVVEKETLPDIVETIRLTALWTQGGETWAIINGRTHKAGDVIGRLTLETATQDGVWIAHWRGRDFVELGSDFTLVTPAGAATQFQATSPQGT